MRKNTDDNLLFDLSKIKFNKVILLYDVVFLFLLTIFSYFTSFYFIPFSRDFDNYANFYRSLSSVVPDFTGERFEFGFQFISKQINFLFPGDVRFLYLFVVSTSLYIKYFLFFRFSEFRIRYAGVILLFYLMSFFFVFEVNQLRAALAISLGFLSIYSFSKGNVLKSFILLCLSISFHYSAIVFLFGNICIFFAKKKQVFFLVVLIILGCVAAKYLIYIIESINPIAAEYKNNYEGATFGVTSFTFIFPMIYLVYHGFFIKKENSLNIGLLLFLFAGLLFSLTMSSIPVYAIRILEMIEICCLLVTLNRKFTTYYDYGSAFLLFVIIFHKFVAYTIVNPLYNL